MIWTGLTAYMDMRNAYATLVIKPEEKIPLGRTMCCLEDNIKTGCASVGWVEFTQDCVQ
jgi:hypothetical protein